MSVPAAPLDAAPPVLAFVARSETETQHIAHVLARLLRPGDVLALRGDLGAGKTTFVRALAGALGVAPAEVSSPTFTLLHEHNSGRMPLLHWDVYRLSGPDALADLGWDDYLRDGGAVIVVEWADRIEAALPLERLDVFLAEVDENASGGDVDGGADEARRITLAGRGARWADLVAAWKQAGAAC